MAKEAKVDGIYTDPEIKGQSEESRSYVPEYKDIFVVALLMNILYVMAL